MGVSLGKLRSRRHNHHRLHDHDPHDQQHHQFFPSTTITPPINQLSSPSSANTITNTTNPNSNTISLNNPIPSSSIDTNTNTNSNSILQTPSPPPPPSFAFAAHAPYLPQPSPPPALSRFSYNSSNYFVPPPRPNSFTATSSGWVPNRYPHASPASVPVPPPYVDHSHAKKIKNDVNVHKDSIRLVVDEKNVDSHLVSFTFDALVDGSITISYFAKEELNCKFMPLYPEICTPMKIPFEKGLRQKFCQPSGTGIDLGFFELDHLSKPSPGEDIFPLVICAEACIPSLSSGDQPLPAMSHAQITQAVLDKNNEGQFQVKVAKQILWIDGIRYELREIYGLGNSENVSDIDDKETGKECVICMTEPKDTAVLPCRHMCLCSECAKALRLQSNKCPICRQPIQELMEIKINKDNPFL